MTQPRQLDMFGAPPPPPEPADPPRIQVGAYTRSKGTRKAKPEGVRTVYDSADRLPRAPVLTLQAKFERFDAKYPDVYAQLLDLARQWRAGGKGTWSINGMFEVLRWQRRALRLDADEPFRMNNNYRAFYARKLLQEEGLAGMFEVRRQTFS